MVGILLIPSPTTAAKSCMLLHQWNVEGTNLPSKKAMTMFKSWLYLCG